MVLCASAPGTTRTMPHAATTVNLNQRSQPAARPAEPVLERNIAKLLGLPLPVALLLQFLQVLASQFAGEWQKLPVANHFFLTLATQHVTHEFPHLGRQRLAGLAIQNPGLPLVQRPRTVTHTVHGHGHVRTAVTLAEGDSLGLR